MTHIPTDPDDFLSAMKDAVKPLSCDDNYVSGVAIKPLVIDLPHRAGASTRVGHDRDTTSAGGREMDGNMAARVRAGKIRPQARLDLHGDTLDQARARVQNFVTTAVDRGLRCVLVITGKGTYGAHAPQSTTDPASDFYTHDIQKRGRIRDHLPLWMNEAPMNRLVLLIAPAQPKDGGSGAFYVYLRQVRQN